MPFYGSKLESPNSPAGAYSWQGNAGNLYVQPGIGGNGWRNFNTIGITWAAGITPSRSTCATERISPDTASPGDTVEIQGRHFGRHQANRVFSMNRFGSKTRMTVLDWSDSLIRAQVPARLDPGQYVVLIYYDGLYVSSSDSVRMTIERSP